MTINKSQSQTLHKVLLDCTSQPFSHGHTYVALSRVREARNIRLFIQPDALMQPLLSNPYPTITNVVYKDMLRGVQQL